MDEKKFLNTREVARFLDINEKAVYALINEKGLPGTKVTGKWLFPRHMVEKWLESQTVNAPVSKQPFSEPRGPLIIAGSNDILLDRVISVFNRRFDGQIAVFGNVGSKGGIDALADGLCHMATSHLLGGEDGDYNFAFLDGFAEPPAVVNFCLREQGLLVGKGNPLGIRGVEDLAGGKVRVVNRAKGTGTRLLFDTELEKAGIDPDAVDGYGFEVSSHLEVGIEIASGRAGAGPGIRAVARLLGLDFIPWRWERFDFLVSRDSFFDRRVQAFLGTIHEEGRKIAEEELEGYDLKMCGRMVFPGGISQEKG